MDRGRRALTLATAAWMVAGCMGGSETPVTAQSGTDAPATRTTALPAIVTPSPPEASKPAAPSTVITCDEGTIGCAGPLTPGQHTTDHFDHPFSFTVPEGWTNDRDIGRAYALRAAAAPNAEFLVWSHAAPAMQTPDCSAARRPGFGTSVAEWLRSLSSDDRVAVTKRETFDLGGRAATRVEIATKGTFKMLCPDNTDPFAVIVTDTFDPPTRAHGGGRSDSIAFASMTLIDFGDDAIVIWNDGGDVALARMVELAVPVIRSIRFANGQ